jgi:CheY-like chemotaxis protein
VILVVDDEKVVRELARRALGRQGHEVLEAEDGPAAIDVVRSQGSRLQVMILDAGLPGMNGAEALVHIHGLKPDLEVIVSSGYSEEQTLGSFAGARVAGFIQKPYLAQDLVRAVQSALTKKQTSP